MKTSFLSLSLGAAAMLASLPASARDTLFSSGGYTAGSAGVTVGATDTSAYTTSNAGTIDTRVSNGMVQTSTRTTASGMGPHYYSGTRVQVIHNGQGATSSSTTDVNGATTTVISTSPASY